MENLMWVIYLIDVICDDWVGLGLILFILFITSSACFVAKCVVDSEENPNQSDKVFAKTVSKFPLKTIMVLTSFLALLLNFIPSKDTAYKMLAVYGVNEVYENKDVQDIMGDGVDILKLTLKQYKEELESK